MYGMGYRNTSRLLDHHFVLFAVLFLSLFSLLSLSLRSATLHWACFCLTCAGCYVNLTTTPIFSYSQRILDYPLADYPVYGLSVCYHKLLTTNDEVGRLPEQDPQYSNRNLSCVFVYIRRYEEISIGDPEGSKTHGLFT